MSNLKRATPWLVTMSFLLVCYIAAYCWLYKARYGYHEIGSRGVVHVVFRPLAHWDHSRMVKKRQREARAFCQGTWKGESTLRDAANNRYHQVTYKVTIHGDTLTITEADHATVLVGKTWKIRAFDHNLAIRKDDHAPPNNSDLKVFNGPNLMTATNEVVLPWFPYYKAVPPVTYTAGQRAHLKRATP